MRKSILALALSSVLVSGAALAQQAGYSTGGTFTPPSYNRPTNVDNIGNEGQLVFGADRLMGLYWERDTTTTTVGNQDTTSTDKTMSVALLTASGATPFTVPRLSLDYFVIEGLSIGGSVGYLNRSAATKVDSGSSSEENDTYSAHAFVLAPRAGFAAPFDDTFGLWARGGITYVGTGTTLKGRNGAADRDLSGSWVDLTLEANLVISPIEHVAFLVGPFWDFPLSGSTDQTSINGAGETTTTNVDNTQSAVGLTVGFVGYY